MQAGDDRHAGLRDPVQGIEHGGRRLGIEARDRLVRQDHPGLLRQRAGDGHALLLAARELVGARVRPVEESHGVQTAERELAVGTSEAPQEHAPGRHDGEASRQHVLQRREPADQVELLEDQRDALPGRRSSRRLILRMSRPPSDTDPASAVGEPGQAAEERRLAGAARPEHGDELAGLARRTRPRRAR